MSINICIIDDNLIDIERIKNEIIINTSDEFDPHIKTINQVNNLESIPLAQIYFIDIDLPKYDGFTIANYLLNRNKYSYIIFVTNREDLVFNSFALNTFFFARKSTLKYDIKRSINKYLCSLHDKDFMILEFDHNTYQINKSDIVWIESKGNYLLLHTKHIELKIRHTLKSLIQELNKQEFIKIHNSFLVNTNYISRVHKNNCYLINGTILPISLSNKHALITRLKSRKNCI